MKTLTLLLFVSVVLLSVNSAHAQSNAFGDSLRKNVKESSATKSAAQKNIVGLNMVEKYLENLAVQAAEMTGVDENAQETVLNRIREEIAWVAEVKNNEITGEVKTEWAKRSEVRYLVYSLKKLAGFKTLYAKVADLYEFEQNDEMKTQLDVALSSYRKAAEAIPYETKKIDAEMKRAYKALLLAVETQKESTESASGRTQ